MALKDIQTQIITQFPSPVTGQLLGFIAASLRVFDVTSSTAPSQIGSVAMTLTPDATILISPNSATVLFITDGSSLTNRLYSVSIASLTVPVILQTLSVV